VIGTMSYQTLFTRFVSGRPLHELAQSQGIEQVLQGELVIPGLIVMGFAPWLFEMRAMRAEED